MTLRLRGHIPASLCRLDLDLLVAPAGIGFAHVARGFDGGDELEGDVADTDEANGAASNFAEDALAEDETADENVDFIHALSERHLGRWERASTEDNLQAPRPTKEKRNEA